VSCALGRHTHLYAGGRGSTTHDMGVTHVIRGERPSHHAAPGPRIYNALGWRVPVMAHILAHPRARRLEALQAPWRARGRRLPGHGLPAGGAAQLPGPSRLEPWRPGDVHHRGDDRGPSTCRRSAARPRVSTSPSSRISTAITSETRATTTCWPRSRACFRMSPTARSSPPGSRPSSRPKLLAALPSLKERAKTLVELVDSAKFLYATARSRSTTRPRPAHRRGARPDGEARRQARAVEPLVREATEAAGARLRGGRRRQARAVAQPLRAALTGRATSPGIFEVLVVLGKTGKPARLGDQAA